MLLHPYHLFMMNQGMPPSIATFSVAEDLRLARHADFVVATNLTTGAVEHSNSASDSLDFGDAGEGGNIHQECNLGIVEPPDQINAPSRAASPTIPLTAITASLPSRLQHTPWALYKPISQSPSNTQRSKSKRYWPHIAYGTCCSP